MSNWYRYIKFSQRKPAYTDVGHDFGMSPVPNVLWMIDENWQMRTQKVERHIQTHGDWFRLNGLTLIARYSIAQGRYAVQDNIITIGVITKEDIGMPKSQVLQNVHAMLNESFGSSKIINFAKSKNNMKIQRF